MKDKKPDKNSIGVLSWIITVILLSTFWPAGVILLVMRLSGNDVLSKLLYSLFLKADVKRSEMQRPFQQQTQQPPRRSQQQTYQQSSPYMAQSHSSSQSRAARYGQEGQYQTGEGENGGQAAPRTGYAPPQSAQPQTPFWQQPAAQPEDQEKRDGVDRISKGRVLLIVFGWLLVAAGALTMFELLSNGALWRAIGSLAIALGGGGMLFASWKKKRKELDYQNCIKIVGDRASIDLRSLSAALGRKAKDVEKDLSDMVERGYFGEAAYFDRSRNVLIIDPGEAEDELQKAAAASPEGKDQYQLLLMELDRSIQRIRDPEMQQKALRLRGLVSSIFDAVREDPSKRSRIGTFLNYYFPQTLKLMNNYADFETKEFQGENISKARERIEGATDLLISAYQKQLDSLYLSTTMDVDSDVDVLETMLKRDGLTGGDFTGLGEQGGQQQGGV